MPPVLIAFVSAAALLVGCASSPREARYRPDWLSPAAEIVYTSRWEDGFLGDATLKLKARTSKAEFESAVKQLDLTPYGEVPKSSYTNEPPQRVGDSDKRWDPGAELDDTCIRKEGRWWQLAKYRNGFLYYQSVRY